jgi:hypothetical protein
MIPARQLAASCFAALFIGMAAHVPAQPAASGDSPFLPPAGAAKGGAQPLSNPYELTGTSKTSRETKVCIYDAQARSSHWIAVGSAYGDVQVVSYDPASDRAVINVHGSRMSLDMRKAVVSKLPGFATAPSPKPVSGPVVLRSAGPPAQTQSAETLKQEREARMLVSDLLDIGMQQRKAYEEAQKAAQQSQQARQPQPTQQPQPVAKPN